MAETERTVLEQEVAALIAAAPHYDGCDSLSGSACDCDRDARIAQRVYNALQAAWRFNPYSRNVSGVLQELKGEAYD